MIETNGSSISYEDIFFVGEQIARRDSSRNVGDYFADLVLAGHERVHERLKPQHGIYYFPKEASGKIGAVADRQEGLSFKDLTACKLTRYPNLVLTCCFTHGDIVSRSEERSSKQAGEPLRGTSASLTIKESFESII